MYGVVQFATSDGGTTAIVVNKWLTPRKTEVYWPPVKESKKFDQLLHKCLSPDHNKWKLYKIERVFCETDSLDKAKNKLKLSEVTSDLQTEGEDDELSKRQTKRTRRYVSTDIEEEDGDVRLVQPPPLKKDISKYLYDLEEETRSVTPTATITEIIQITSPEGEAHAHTLIAGPNTSLLSNDDIANPFPSSTPKVAKLTGFQDKVISLLSHLKNQNEQMLAMLKGTLETAELDTDFVLPIKSEEEVRATEDLLKRDDKYANLVKYLKSIGGRDLSNKVSRVMKILLLDSVAAHYSFYGKRSNKKAFSELLLEKCVVDAVNSSTQGITAKHVEDQIKVWLKHAPDRNKLRNHK